MTVFYLQINLPNGNSNNLIVCTYENIFQSLSIAALLGLFVPFISSCSDDEEVFNEWNATYVSLQRNDYLSGNVKKFNLTHDANGIGGDEIKMAFTVKTQKAVSTDMVIALSAKSETEGLDASQIVLSSSQVTLKEGQMTSEEITATVDPTIFASIMEKTSFSFSVSISNVTTNDKNTVISSSLSTLPVIINKAAYCNLKSGIPSNSQLISNRAGWIINVEEGVEGAPNNLIDGKTGTDVALNNKGFWFTVDLGEAKVLTGIKTNHWANAYAPREVEILQSENGTTWKSLSSLAISGGTQNITFISPITTRYLKYQIITISTNGRTDVTEFNVYEPKNE